jgi:hypothetical protein
MQRRDDRHRQPGQQAHDMASGGTAEDAEFMLERDRVEPIRVQEIGGARVIFNLVIFYLAANDGWIVVSMAMVGHRHDRGIKVWARRRDRLLKMRRECRDSATARQRIPDKCQMAEPGHGRATVDAFASGVSDSSALVNSVAMTQSPHDVPVS